MKRVAAGEPKTNATHFEPVAKQSPASVMRGFVLLIFVITKRYTHFSKPAPASLFSKKPAFSCGFSGSWFK
jgi:hypothetical protein